MRNILSVLPQYLAPQHALTRFVGWFANSRLSFIKNNFIHFFIKRYKVDMQPAVIEDPYAYATFNDFFTRYLKPELRPVVQDPQQIACPVDGCVSQLGQIEKDRLFQAKGFYFNLKDLLGGSSKLADTFTDGSFATFYLAPKDYHRIHMPFKGKLRQNIFIPGKLFSVNKKTAENVSKLFARNERLVCLFDTEIGPMALILVGAMIVGSINTVWFAKTRSSKIVSESYGGSLEFDRGAELGHFKLGSTVIVLFGKDKVAWSEHLKETTTVRMGQPIGNILAHKRKG